MKSKDFDLLRDKAEALDASLMTKLLFMDVISSMEKIENKLTAFQVNIQEHDHHGRVELEEDAEKES
jgi:hypothetical protein